MNFDRPDRRRPAGLSRKEQYRLIGLVLVLGLVIAAMDAASKPSAWTWLLPPTDAPSEAVAAAEAPGALQGEAEASEPLRDQSDRPRLFEPDVFEGVRDNTVGFRRSESAAFSRVVGDLADFENPTLTTAAREDVTYAVLAADSEKLRGEVLKLSGQLRRLNPLAVPEDLDGLPDLWEAWILTSDSGDRPIRVVTLAADDSIPRGDDVGPVAVSVDAVYFKRYGYAANGGGRVAPMFIAKRVEALPAAMQPQKDRLTSLLTVFLVVPLAFVAFAFARTVGRQKRRRIEFRHASSAQDGPGSVEANSPAEFLSNLTVEEPEPVPASLFDGRESTPG